MKAFSPSGEDVGYFGGVFGVTRGLQEKHGTARVFDAPINEGAIVAMAMGMATTACARSRKSSLPTISFPVSTRSFPSFHVSAIARPASTPRR